MTMTTIGIDLAKNVFQIHGVDGSGKAVLKKQLIPVLIEKYCIFNDHGYITTSPICLSNLVSPSRTSSDCCHRMLT
jgi:hypothetical protein